jgi:hypothetical protein
MFSPERLIMSLMPSAVAAACSRRLMLAGFSLSTGLSFPQPVPMKAGEYNQRTCSGIFLAFRELS